jgi:2-hydroxy-3-keto-5-methylthiopentenyl-1-phosphate phosphatase
VNDRKSASAPVAVVCDFDGTATVLDIGDEISKHFGGLPHWETESARFRRGELDTRGIIEAIYARVTASEAEIRAFAAERARLRQGFAELVAACRDRGAPFILASGGLRQYIEAVLEAHLEPALRAHVQVRANEARFASGAGERLRVAFPGEATSRELGCSACGSCKRVAVRDLREAGAAQVIGLGDGFADRCLAQFADRVFARAGSYLQRHCEANRVAYTPFETMHAAAEAVAAYR